LILNKLLYVSYLSIFLVAKYCKLVKFDEKQDSEAMYFRMYFPLHP